MPKARRPSNTTATTATTAGTRSAKKAPRRTASAAKPLSQAASAAGRAVSKTVAGVAARVMPDPHDPIAMLERDHRRLEELFERGSKTTARAGRARTALLATLKAELEAHELVEEKVLYPALEPHGEARDIVLEGYQEHHVADILVRELERLSPDDERWGAKFTVLKENIEHHIEEEEGDMFRTARVVLGRDRLAAIGRRMEALKRQRRKRRS